MRVLAVSALLCIGSMVTACGDDVVEEVENTIDCADVCERYESCYDDDFDVSACIDRCEDAADASENRESRLERCDACMDEESCASAVFECAADCVGVVP